MHNLASALLLRCGIEPRAFLALTGAFLLMDLRGPHFSQSTGVRPREVLSPLVCVIGQCLLLSAIVSLTLFLRVDVFMYALAGVGVSMLVVASSVIVEFNEVVFDARDMEAIAPRPVSPRTYSAARFANLLAYVLGMWLALNIFPLIVGAALYDAGWWYAPAYGIASLAADVTTACAVILAVSAMGRSPRLERWKDLLAWTQVALLLIAGYGAQLLFRRRDYSLELWAAFPPEWIRFLPPAWLAWFVEQAAVTPTTGTLGVGVMLLALTALACLATVVRLGGLYADVQPSGSRSREIIIRAPTVGGLSNGLVGVLCRNSAERAGFWLCRTFLARDAGMRMRCLYALNTVVAVVVLGLGTGQFANPLVDRDVDQVLLPLMAVYLTCLAVPVALYNLTFVKDADAAWALFCAPVEPPHGLARGACKALQAYIITPVCVVLAAVAAWAWRDPLSAVLHAGLAWSLSWLTALASLWLASPAHPFTREPARGGSIGPIALPLAGFSAVAMVVAAAHYCWAPQAWFWIAATALGGVITVWVGRRADARLQHLWERGT